MNQVMKTVQTPLEQLKAKKELVRNQAKIHEENLSNNFKYLQDNAGKLVVSSVTSAILPIKSSPFHSSASSSLPSTLTDLAMSGVSTYLRGSKGILPLAWGVVQPFLFTWGIKGAKKLIGSLFQRKKKNKRK